MDPVATFERRRAEYAAAFATAEDVFPSRARVDDTGALLLLADGTRHENPYDGHAAWPATRRRHMLIEGPLAAADATLVAHGLVCPPAPAKRACPVPTTV